MAVEQAPVAEIQQVLESLPVRPAADTVHVDRLLDLVAEEKQETGSRLSASQRLVRGLVWGAFSAALVYGIAFWLSSGQWINRYLPR